MSKVHIALVGGQPIPVYLGIMEDEECEKVLLIHSYSSLKEAQTIQKYCGKKCSFIEYAPTDIEAIKKATDEIRKAMDEDEVTLNVTSGTKPWSLIFYQAFSNHTSVRIIYIDQLNRWYNLKSEESKLLNIDIFKRFELYENPLKRYRTLDYFSETDYKAIGYIETVRNKHIGAFTDLTNRDKDEYNKEEGEIISKNGSIMRWNWNEGWVNFEMINYNGFPLKPIRIELDHAKEVVLNTAWFELKTALELRNNPNVKDIYIGCEFLLKDEKAKNEIDVIADFGSRLIFIECKTMISEITAIDKFRSAMRNFSGTSSTGVFVTNDRVSKGTRYERYMATMEKCKDNDIITFNFGLWNKKEDSSLNSIINEAITKINKR